MTYLQILLLPLGLLLTLATAHASDEAKAKYQTCVACHGESAQGNVELAAPALAGQAAFYIQRQLEHFKAGVRGADPRDEHGAQMKAMAATVADDDIVVISEYLAALPAPAPAAPIDGDLKNGNNYYQANCGACHGGQAEGNESLNAPALGLLDPVYLKTQFQNFQSGVRGTHADDPYGRQMKMMSVTLPTDKDLDDVIAYIQSVAAPQ